MPHHTSTTPPPPSPTETSCRNYHHLLLSPPLLPAKLHHPHLKHFAVASPEPGAFCSPECFWTAELSGAQGRSRRKGRGGARPYSRSGSEEREEGDGVGGVWEDVDAGERGKGEGEANAMFEFHDLNGWA
mmetsp:Transcript_8645/g.21513  ORF Transcript_8645/g.21513 Transcript_8645/m.21513 type:complete len:130 (+) Transcript_8645:132-521(+)